MKRNAEAVFVLAVVILMSVTDGASAMDRSWPAGGVGARSEAGVGSSAPSVAITLSAAGVHSGAEEMRAAIPRNALGQGRFEVDWGLAQVGFRSLVLEVGYSWRW